ncbi:hypothetical protein AALP_AAs55352U000100 [Arabis alpina]|uniref:Uncharacterized protein n=1 Tax=Arabis alpina TaxID=50452 RepID=A0A087FZX4_ARAAL|nr:hypothetical protein AALP_AAs55352U000100 [Arabis alpina]
MEFRRQSNMEDRCLIKNDVTELIGNTPNGVSEQNC